MHLISLTRVSRTLVTAAAIACSVGTFSFATTPQSGSAQPPMLLIERGGGSATPTAFVSMTEGTIAGNYLRGRIGYLSE